MESVKAPFEYVSASFRRTQKQLSSEMKEIVSMFENLQNKNDSEIEGVICEVEEKIAVLQEALDDANVVEKDQLKKIEARCQEFQPLSTTSVAPLKSAQPSAVLSERRELVLIGDFLLRRGQLEAVDSLIEESGEWLGDMLDVQIYKTAAAVEASVHEGRLDLALQWMQDHASKLRRLNSALEFFLRQEQFLSLVYRGRSLEALRFAQVLARYASAPSDKPSGANGNAEKSTDTLPQSLYKKTDRSGSFASQGSDDSSPPPSTAAATSTPPRFRARAVPQRQRAVSLGTPPTSRGGGSSRIFSPYRPSRTSASVTGTGGVTGRGEGGDVPPRHRGTTTRTTASDMSSLPVSLPFSFSANPLAFFRYSRGTSDSAAGTRGRSSSGSFTDFLSGDATFVPPAVMSSESSTEQQSCAVTAQEQSTYMKEAMCHLMSLLAFMSQTDESGTDDEAESSVVQASKKSKGSNDSSTTSSTPSLFGSMVPCLYEQMYTPHRRRCIVDLFRVEFRRVYSLSHVSALEQYVKTGVFALKTPSCGVHPKSPQAKCSGDSSGSASAGSSGGVIDALRYVRQSIRTVRNRVRTSSGGSSGGADEMEVDTENEVDFFDRLSGGTATSSGGSSAGRTPPPSRHNGKITSSGSPEAAIGTASFLLSGRNSKDLRQQDVKKKLAPECPVCTPSGQIISASIPVYAARSESMLVCRGSGEIMNHDNPPVALPNGQVFSKSFVMSQARPKEKDSRRKLSAWEKLKLNKDKVQELDEPSQNDDTSSGSKGFDKYDESEKMSSIFGGCYCGGSVNGDLSTCVSPSSTTASSKHPHVFEDQKECGISSASDLGGGKPLSAIEVMMRLSGGSKSDNVPTVDRRALAVTSLAGEMRRMEREVALENAAHHTDEDEEEEGYNGRKSGERNMSDSPPLPPPPLYFTCPVTGSSFDISTLKAVFIV